MVLPAYSRDPASKSDYSYHINRKYEIPVVVIMDLDQGRMSVTNNVEAVANKVIAAFDLDPGDLGKKYLMIYRDSMGIYDGIELIGNNINIFKLPGVIPHNEAQAAKAAVAAAVKAYERRCE